MEEHLFIVIWKDYKGTWRAQEGGVLPTQRLAENLIECKKAAGETFEFAWIEGPITSPAMMAETKDQLLESSL